LGGREGKPSRIICFGDEWNVGIAAIQAGESIEIIQESGGGARNVYLGSVNILFEEEALAKPRMMKALSLDLPYYYIDL